MSRRERRDSDRHMERRDGQPDDEQQRRSGEADAQEGDSLAALKAILAKVAGLLKPLQLSPEESIRLVEQLYGSVLETDVRLAGETDDRRKSSVLLHIQNTTISRDGSRIVVEFPSGREPAVEVSKPTPREPSQAETASVETPRRSTEPAGAEDAETPVAETPVTEGPAAETPVAEAASAEATSAEAAPSET